MVVSARWYANGARHFLNKDIGWNSDSFRLALHTSAYTPNVNTDEFQSVLAGEVPSAGGYVTGGELLTTLPLAVIPDTSVSAYVNAISYVIGDLVRPSVANGFIYRCIEAVTSRVSGEPIWTTSVGRDFADDASGQQWENVGSSHVKLDGADVQWGPTTTITARYAVVYVDGPNSTGDYVVGYIDFGQDESSANGTFDVQFHVDGILHAIVSL